ncbi:MAG: NADH:ubiquinone reductase (Na(+)-transporting) subunit C [Bacteroidota bacterium]
MFSNKYIFTYASVMVILVAAVLSTASMVLKPFQEANIMAEKIQGILAAANVEAERDNAASVYNEKIVKELSVDSEGNVVSTWTPGEEATGEAIRPFDINLKQQLELEKNPGDEKPVWPIFIIEKEGQQYYVVPVRGMGLWGPVWGNIAFESDFNTIAGANFDHKGETPGLGAEINTDWFESKFKGKKIFNDQGEFVSVKVVKGGVENSAIPVEHGVDGISGGTITSEGVTEMLQSNLENYVPYIKKNV